MMLIQLGLNPSTDSRLLSFAPPGGTPTPGVIPLLTLIENSNDSLELLAILSPTPAEITDLKADLGAWDDFKLHNEIKKLRTKMHLGIHVRKHKVWIADESWEDAKMIALSYIERMYR